MYSTRQLSFAVVGILVGLEAVVGFTTIAPAQLQTHYSRTSWGPAPFASLPSATAAGTTTALGLSSSSSNKGDNDDADFMAALKSRMQQSTDRATRLPLVVLDSMLPRQVLKINVINNPVFMELVRQRIVDETPSFGMLGMARLANGQPVQLRSGVVVDIVGKPVVTTTTTTTNTGNNSAATAAAASANQQQQSGGGGGSGSLQIVLKGSQRFRITGEVENAPEGWTQARVEFLSDKDDESFAIRSSSSDNGGGGGDRLSLARAMSKARKLDALVAEWIALARTKERQAGQIDELLQDLQEMPSSEEPTDRAFWVGALINPIPALGVAQEIRPSLLSSSTAEERVDIVLQGIQKSIRHMQQGEPLVS